VLRERVLALALADVTVRAAAAQRVADALAAELAALLDEGDAGNGKGKAAPKKAGGKKKKKKKG
jgi:hypothetical protein